MKIQSLSLPIGSYVCEFVGVKAFCHSDFGPGLRWEFQVIAGRYKGLKTSRVTKDVPTPNNSAGRFLAALAGTTPTEDMDIDEENFIGNLYRVEVAASPGSLGSTRVETFVPLESEEEDNAEPPAPVIEREPGDGDDEDDDVNARLMEAGADADEAPFE